MSLYPYGRRWPSLRALAVATLGALAACAPNGDVLVAPRSPASVPSAPRAARVALSPSAGVVISHVYGGGGNSGAFYRHDFVELYNGGADTVDLTGASIQYASAAGTFGNNQAKTALVGFIAPGRFYLVQQGAGANGNAANLPTPDLVPAARPARDSIAFGGTGGKLVLVNSTVNVTNVAVGANTNCPVAPAGAAIIDFVGYGTTSCAEGGSGTSTPSNTSSVYRRFAQGGGLQDTQNNNADFLRQTLDASATVAPRNSAVFLAPSSVLSATISPANPSAIVGGTVNFTASASIGGSAVPITMVAWQSSNPAAATIDAGTGVATAVGVGATTITATVTTASGNATATTTLTVNSSVVVTLTASPTGSVTAGTPVTYTAAATAGGSPVAITGATWTSSNPNAATIAPNVPPSTATATTLAAGTTTIGVTVTTASGQATASTALSVVGGGAGVVTTIETPPTGSIIAGFWRQLFTTVRDGTGAVIPGVPLTWTSANPATASIAVSGIEDGIVRGEAPGTVTITATSANGRTGTTAFTVTPGTFGNTELYGDHLMFGAPVDGDASNDFRVTRAPWVGSYNASRGGPNWVAYRMTGTNLGTLSGRCDCFTPDPLVPGPVVTTLDYVNAGGGIYDRGHMVRSNDRELGTWDQATTFYLSNIVPQHEDNNQGRWGDLEMHLESVVRNQGVDAYVYAGAYGSLGRLHDKVTIPSHVWKVVVLVPAGRTLADVRTAGDITEVIAVNMPNVSLPRDGNWQTHRTTVDAIEAASGYDVLGALPDAIEAQLEAGKRPPVPALAGPTGGNEGQSLAFSAAGSTDPDGSAGALTYQWSFGDGTTATGVAPVKSFVDNGTYTVTLTVTDADGLQATRTRQVVVVNVAPVASLTPTTTTVKVGTAFNPIAAFTDAGVRDAAWRAVVEWGDGTSTTASLVSLPTGPIRASKSYATPGERTIRFTVTDKDGGTHTVTRAVTVVP